MGMTVLNWLKSYTSCHNCSFRSESLNHYLTKSSVPIIQLEFYILCELFYLFHVRSHQYSRALQLARKAWDVLIIYQTPDHPDCIELSEMINLLQTQL